MTILRQLASVRVLGWGVCSVLLIAENSLPAAANHNGWRADYQIILDRNPFGLGANNRAVPQPTQGLPADFPEYRLTGISTLAGSTQAFLTREIRGHPREYLSLREGQQEGPAAAVWINARAGAILLRHETTQLLLSFQGQEELERAAELEEQRFNEEHERAHERYEAEERERERLELEEAERELARRTPSRS